MRGDDAEELIRAMDELRKKSRALYATLAASGTDNAVERLPRRVRFGSELSRLMDGLTSDTKGEIIIFIGRNSRFARTLARCSRPSCALILPSFQEIAFCAF